MHKISIRGKRAFLSSFKKKTEFIIFPQAHWTVRVRRLIVTMLFGLNNSIVLNL